MNYHALDIKEVIKEFNSDTNGLDEKDSLSRLSKYGENTLRKTRHFNALKVFFSQFNSFLILVLIFAAILSIFMKSIIDSAVIFVIILLNSSIGFFQEYKAERAIQALKKMMVPEAKVLRNGRIIRINSREIVPGDILILSEGDKIMADARILKSDGLKVNEAALTGESVAESKKVVRLVKEVSLADRVNMVYQGTQVVFGSGRAIVINTGMNTELGRISELVQEIKPEKNPFKENLDLFAKKLGIFILVLAMIIIGLMMWQGAELFQSFLIGVSLAVSAIPEGLPAVIALGLAFATKAMLKKNVLVRRLPASETLGRTTVICVDKTGTLTEEKMEVSDVYMNGKINPSTNVNLLLKIGILCNKARLEIDKNGKEYLIGDPTEKALVISAKNNSLDKKELTEKEPKIREFAFSSERKMMSVIRQNEKKIISYVKGAPEKIIENSSYELINNREIRLSDARKKELIDVYGKMAKKGLRVLGFAYKEVDEGVSQKNAEKDLVFVGFQGMIDPPRNEVKGAIELAKQAGINVIMITGDSKLTADAVASEIGLTGESIDSKQLNKMSDTELFKQIKGVSVFSRISPEDKLRIINALKKRDEIVAMTGDGVNDSLALKRADIGIAMGVRGTDVARDSSDIILRDDNFASIVEGVREGRRIYSNVKKFIKFLLSANFSEVALILLVILIWRDPALLPLLPLQILWINLITDGLPALALSLEPMELEIMKNKPDRKSILKGIKLFIFIASAIPLFIYFLFFYKYMQDMVLARTMIVTSAVMFQMALVFSCKSEKFVFSSGKNKWLVYAVLFSIGLHLLALYTPLAGLFGFVALGVSEWYWILGLILIGVVIVETYKFIRRKVRNL